MKHFFKNYYLFVKFLLQFVCEILTSFLGYEFSCPTVSDKVTFYANPRNCAQFYQCHQGQKVLMNCPPDFYWNDNDKVCDFPDAATCGKITYILLQLTFKLNLILK